MPSSRLDDLHNLSPARAEKEAARLLLEVTGNKTLVLLMENLDDIFRGLAQREQGAFRAFLQDRLMIWLIPCCACLTISRLTTNRALPGSPTSSGNSSSSSPITGFPARSAAPESGAKDTRSPNASRLPDAFKPRKASGLRRVHRRFLLVPGLA